MAITLCLTHDCNLRCAYCYAGRKSCASMSRETAQAAIDFAVNRQVSARQPLLILGFFGGEPLLEWQTLQEADAYADERCRASGLALQRTITTNMTLLTEDKIDWLVARHYRMGLSLDGTAESHNISRVYADGRGSHADCLRALHLADAHGANAEIIAVASPANLSHLADSVRFLADQSHFDLAVNPDFTATWSEQACAEFTHQYEAIADFFIERFRIGKPIHVTWLNGKIKTHLYGGYQSCDKCRAGEKELAVAPSGNFYPCPNLVADDAREDIRLGNVHTGFDYAKAAQSLAHCGCTDPVCRDCPIVERCMNWCYCVNYFTSSGKTDHVGSFTCFHEKLAVRLADRVAETLWAERNPDFIRIFYSPQQPS